MPLKCVKVCKLVFGRMQCVKLKLKKKINKNKILKKTS